MDPMGYGYNDGFVPIWKMVNWYEFLKCQAVRIVWFDLKMLVTNQWIWVVEVVSSIRLIRQESHIPGAKSEVSPRNNTKLPNIGSFWGHTSHTHDGSVCMVYMVCHLPSIYPSHVSINLPYNWIRHGIHHVETRPYSLVIRINHRPVPAVHGSPGSPRPTPRSVGECLLEMWLVPKNLPWHPSPIKRLFFEPRKGDPGWESKRYEKMIETNKWIQMMQCRCMGATCTGQIVDSELEMFRILFLLPWNS